MASVKRLQDRIDLLNKLYGFKGHTYKRSKTTGKIISSGSGFSLGQAYGGVRLEFITKSGGTRDVSPRLSKPALDEYIGAMINALRYWKERTKLK